MQKGNINHNLLSLHACVIKNLQYSEQGVAIEIGRRRSGKFEICCLAPLDESACGEVVYQLLGRCDRLRAVAGADRYNPCKEQRADNVLMGDVGHGVE